MGAGAEATVRVQTLKQHDSGHAVYEPTFPPLPLLSPSTMAPKPKAKGKSSTPAMPARPGMKLRPDRALNPGTPDMPKKMRTTLEKRREGITNAAAIENKIAQEDSVREQTANNPPPVELKKILRPRIEKPAPAANNEDPSGQGVVDPCSDGPGSSDEYQPAPVDKQASESDDELMDVSEGEGQKPTKAAGRAKKAPKGSLRREVDTERVKQGGSIAEGKRKAPAAERPSKKSKKANIGGIRVDWDRGRTPAVESSAPSRSRSTSSGVMSFLSHRRSASSDVDMPPGSDSSGLWGIASDADDGDEAAYAAAETDAKVARAKVTSIAGIVETDAPGLVGPSARRNRTSSTLRKADVKLTDIPDAIRPQFRTKFTPALLEYTGSIQGWNDPTAVEVVTIWNSVFPDHAVSVEKREDRDLVLVITKLAQDKIDGWRNRIGATGVTVWKTVFKGKSKQEVIADVEWYLSGSDRSRVFYYRDVIEDEETGKTKLMGLFQSFVFSHVFTVHCNATATDGHLGPLGYPMTVPEGALTLTCHAIKRGLNYHRTGQLVIPEGSLGQFSKTNWADHMDFSEMGQDHHRRPRRCFGTRRYIQGHGYRRRC
ncbi:hypothetical protein B0H10DRAFT_2434139 [Mycena sp. CBHHK59/15]|nr:hypothetical protein B0H10DRAFT_2434139 [Mycena sp. CBHHK59/15]